jgi:hypothetical protein
MDSGETRYEWISRHRNELTEWYFWTRCNSICSLTRSFEMSWWNPLTFLSRRILVAQQFILFLSYLWNAYRASTVSANFTLAGCNIEASSCRRFRNCQHVNSILILSVLKYLYLYTFTVLSDTLSSSISVELRDFLLLSFQLVFAL